MRAWLEQNRGKRSTSYFKVRGKNTDNEMRNQSSLTGKGTLSLEKNQASLSGVPRRVGKRWLSVGVGSLGSQLPWGGEEKLEDTCHSVVS